MGGRRAIHDVLSNYVSTGLPMWSEPDALLAHFIQPRGGGLSERCRLWGRTATTAAGAAVAGLLPVSVIVVPAEDAESSAVRDVTEGGAVLVCPDRIVCWRAITTPADPAGTLLTALEVVLGSGSSAEGDPAEPFLERIRQAAARLTQ